MISQRFGPERPDYDPDAILADPDAPLIHKVYAEINIGIRDRGEKWSKCANCGEPYEIIVPGTEQAVRYAERNGLTEEEAAWSHDTVCSKNCAREYAAYVMNPDL